MKGKQNEHFVNPDHYDATEFHREERREAYEQCFTHVSEAAWD